MERIHVRSSMLDSVGYDETTGTLEVKYKSGGIYKYRNVPLEVYLGLMSAYSKGRYFNRYVKGKYRAF